MKIYIDFDGTLFDSSQYYSNYTNIFKKHNININEILNKTYEKDKNFDTISKKLIKEYNLNQNIYEELNTMYKKNYIFKDVIPFLEKYSQKYELILLTLGNINYQKKKIKNSKISKYFKDIIITDKDKSNLNIDYKNGIFIDNNPLELKKFYNSKVKYLIRIKRNTDKYSKLNMDIENIPEFTNFNELMKSNYIDKIGDEINE